jgi:hypothetical protein
MRKRPWERTPIANRQPAKAKRPWERIPIESKDTSNPVRPAADTTALYDELRALTSSAA